MDIYRPLRVFLCHASQDKGAVRELNKKLKSEDWLDPWLDEEKLSLGQHWTTVIEDALDAADIVIIFLSKNSVRKEGFVQRELTYAWEISLEKPRDVIYLIPFRLDDCEVPRYLRARHWGDFFGDKKENTYNVLLRSLRERHNQILRVETEKRINHEKQNDEQILLTSSNELPKDSIVKSGKKQEVLPDFRIRQRDYLLEVSRSITQILELDKLVTKVLIVAIEMLAGQAGMIILKQKDGWQVETSQGINPDFMKSINKLLTDKEVAKLPVRELNRKLKEMTYTASVGLLNGTALPLVSKEKVIGVIFLFRNYPDLFTANDRVLLQAFSDQTAIAITNALLYKEVTSKSN